MNRRTRWHIRGRRLAVRMNVRLLTDSGEILGRTENISATGLLVVLAPGQQIPRQPSLDLSGVLPYDCGPLSCTVRIVWRSSAYIDLEGGTRLALGLHFDEMGAAMRRALLNCLAIHRPIILGVGLRDTRWLSGLSSKAWVRMVHTATEASAIISDQEVAVFIVGEEFEGARAATVLTEVYRAVPKSNAVALVLAAGDDRHEFQELVDQDRIFYLSSRPSNPDELIAIVVGGFNHYHTHLSSNAIAEVGNAEAFVDRKILETAQRLSLQTDLDAAARLAARVLLELLGADRTYHLFYSSREAVLWSGKHGKDRYESAAAGLVGFVARTGQSICLERVEEDPRFDRDADDPDGSGSGRILIEPLLGPSGRVMGLLVLSRDSSRAPFSEQERKTARDYRNQVVGAFSQLLLRNRLNAAAQEQAANPYGVEDLYREQALAARSNTTVEGRLFDLSPYWARVTYWVLVGACVIGLLFFTLGQVSEYASGPAVVRFHGRVDITASVTGTVADVTAGSGDYVAEGALLARLFDAQELASYERVKSEFELALVASLRSPADETLRRSLGTLRSQLDQASAQLSQREIRAPFPGRIGDVRVASGRQVTPGEVVMTLLRDDDDISLIALIPGHYRPQIHPGSSIRFEVTGYAYAYQTLTVVDVSDQVIGPTEVGRYLGPDADVVAPKVPVVIVRANFASGVFAAGSKDYQLYDGMLGTAEIELDSESVLMTLVPGLKAIRPGG